MLKIGLETESLHLHFQNKRIDIFDFIEIAHELGLDGVQINVIKDYNLDENWGALGSNEEKHLKKIKNLLDKYGMFVELDMRDLEYERVKEVIEVANKLGADVIRSYIPIISNIENPVNGAQGAYDIVKVKAEFNMETYDIAYKKIMKILPLLEKNRIKLALENHEYETSEELVKLIEKVNSQWVGILFDFGNSMMAWEEPVEAADKLAKYTFSTHFKDHIVIEDPTDDFGFVVCGVPLGKGNIDLEETFKIILKKSSLTRINIEMCYPYCAQFKREKGAGGVYEVGEGAFKIEKHLYDPSIIKPMEYYYPHEKSEELLEKMLEDQLNGVKESVSYIKKLRQNYMK